MSLSFVPVAFLVGGAALIAWAVRRRRALALLPADWVAVTGKVIATGGTSPRVEYSSPDGRKLRFPAPPATSLTPGAEVRVLVDPLDASRARLADIDAVAARLVRTLVLLGTVSIVLAVASAVAFA